MDKNQLIEITNSLYKLTSLFPKKEPLRYKIREVGNDILASFVSFRPAAISENLVVLQGFLEIARNQNWVSPSQVLNIQGEYSKLETEISRSESESGRRDESLLHLHSTKLSSMPEVVVISSSEQGNRQGKIIEFLKEKGRAQVWELKQVFPQISKRTLRRDFESLLKQGLVERMGERNDTFYRPSSREAKTKVF